MMYVVRCGWENAEKFTILFSIHMFMVRGCYTYNDIISSVKL